MVDEDDGSWVEYWHDLWALCLSLYVKNKELSHTNIYIYIPRHVSAVSVTILKLSTGVNKASPHCRTEFSFQSSYGVGFHSHPHAHKLEHTWIHAGGAPPKSQKRRLGQYMRVPSKAPNVQFCRLLIRARRPDFIK